MDSSASGLACAAHVTCPFPFPPPYNPPFNPTFANLPLISILPTPQVVAQATIDAEIYTYYLLWKSISLLSFEALLGTCTSSPPLTIQGWTISTTANLVEEKPLQQNEVAPFARLARRANAVDPKLIDFLISIRGTQTPTEWGIDFAYNLVLQKLHFLDDTPLHRGFVALASVVWSSFQLELQEVFNAGQLGLITVTGRRKLVL